MARQLDIVESIRLIALRDVENGGSEYFTRFLFRWYSRTFSTPLHVVEELDMWDILTAYFEERFEDMSPESRAEEVANLLEPEEERNTRETAELKEKFEVEQLLQMAKKQNAKAAEPKLPALGMEKLNDTIQPIETIADNNAVPEGVELTFIPEEDFERLLEGGFANETRKK